MNALWSLINLFVFIHIVTCRDFYLGMFRRNDFLVAQDVIYKAPSPFGYTTANYGRLFKCPITYFRVVDRLGMGRGPITTIVRGGLRKRFISVRIKSTYKLPVSVNIYVGCENKKPSTFRTTLTTSLDSTHATTTKDGEDAGGDDTGGDDAGGDDTTISGGDADKTTDSDGGTTGGVDEAATTGADGVTKNESAEQNSSPEGGATTGEPEPTTPENE